MYAMTLLHPGHEMPLGHVHSEPLLLVLLLICALVAASVLAGGGGK